MRIVDKTFSGAPPSYGGEVGNGVAPFDGLGLAT